MRGQKTRGRVKTSLTSNPETAMAQSIYIPIDPATDNSARKTNPWLASISTNLPHALLLTIPQTSQIFLTKTKKSARSMSQGMRVRTDFPRFDEKYTVSVEERKPGSKPLEGSSGGFVGLQEVAIVACFFDRCWVHGGGPGVVPCEYSSAGIPE